VVIKEGKEKEAELPFMALGYLISLQVFEQAPLEMHLCDQRLKTVKVIEIKPASAKDAEKERRSDVSSRTAG
jgi:hypothetical protein